MVEPLAKTLPGSWKESLTTHFAEGYPEMRKKKKRERPRGFYRTLVIGHVYSVRSTWNICSRWRHCKFIKVTRKGFNLLDVDTSKTILNKACYAKGFGGIEIPWKQQKFTVWFPEWIEIGMEIAMDNAG